MQYHTNFSGTLDLYNYLYWEVAIRKNTITLTERGDIANYAKINFDV